MQEKDNVKIDAVQGKVCNVNVKELSTLNSLHIVYNLYFTNI